MKRKTFIILLGIILSCWYGFSQARTTYTLEYDHASAIKNVPLKKTHMPKVELYSFGKPSGYKEIAIDSNQSFSLNDDESLEVVSIQGEDNTMQVALGFQEQTIKLRSVVIIVSKDYRHEREI